MRRVAIIQARTGSARLPGKVLADVAGRPMLERVIDRVMRSGRVDAAVVATTNRAADDPVAELARALGVGVFRGDEEDVLSRYLGAAREARAEVVVRVTADCPLLDPEVVARVVDTLCGAARDVDYASNVMTRTFPRGLDVEALFVDVLERVARMSSSQPSREHVTYHILRERPELFATRSVEDVVDNSDLRWTVDEAADLEMVRQAYATLGLDAGHMSYRDICAWMRAHPEVAGLNAHVAQKA
ncbi:MAG: NTP transferase domain-containing protein [Vicinamibacterales bacterium]